MAILTFENKSGKVPVYGALSETITDNIISNVLNDPVATEFLAIISRDRLEQIMVEQNLSYTGRFDEQTVAGIGGVVGVHELVVGQITQIIYKTPNPKYRAWDRQGTIKVQTGTERYVDENGNTKTRPKYSSQKVSARVTYTQVESSVTIIGSYKILDVKTAEFKKADNFTAKHEFNAEWATFTGDPEALIRSDISLTSRPEEHAPVEQQMELEAANQLASYLAETLLRYVKSANCDYLPKGTFFVPPIKVEETQITVPPQLAEDINTDGIVNIQDLVLVASNFARTGENAADVNNDGVVNIADLTLVAGAISNAAGAPSVRGLDREIAQTKN